MQWVFCLNNIYFSGRHLDANCWWEVDDQRAKRLHEEGVALSAGAIKQIIEEIDTTADQKRKELLKLFIFRYLFTMPCQAQKQYGTLNISWTNKDLAGLIDRYLIKIIKEI